MKRNIKVFAITLLLGLMPFADAMALERINDSEHVLGKGRSHVRNICAEADGTWLDGSCLFPEKATGVMLEWRNGRVVSHTLMSAGTTFGYTILGTLRDREGKEDFSGSADGCDVYGWNNVQGLDFAVLICSELNNSGVKAEKS